MALLKVVYTQPAEPMFGNALPLAGLVLIDFGNCLLLPIQAAKRAVTAKIEEIAQNISNQVQGQLLKLKNKFFEKRSIFKAQVGTSKDIFTIIYISRGEVVDLKTETEGEAIDIKIEVEKAKGYLFRGDGLYRLGAPLGFQLNSPEADTANIQTSWKHVQDKKLTQSSRYTSFATTLKGAKKFAEAVIEERGKKVIKKSQIIKVAWSDIKQLENQGLIRIYTPEDVKAQMQTHEEKEVRDNANNVYKNMTKNDEVLIEGQIPGELLKLAK